MSLKLMQLIAAGWLLILSGAVWAADSALDLTLPDSAHYTAPTSFKLVENDLDVVKVKKNLAPTSSSPEVEPPLFSRKKVHQYLGLSTIALAALTTLAAPGDGEGTSQQPRETNGTHANLAKATGVMAIATVASGLISHWDDFNIEDGWSDPDNLHVLFATTGAALMAYAINKSANSSTPVSHAGVAELGALGMLVAIKLTW
jgi:hypothetical protein